MKKQAGFTLIELVTVIVILGILAAFAVPRFVNLSQEARVATVKGMQGSVSAAAALVHAKWLVTTPHPATVTVSGKDVAITNGYPSASKDGIMAALQSHDGFKWNSGQIEQQSASDPSKCAVTYLAATAPGDAPDVDLVSSLDCS